jgi:hypothetical protein
VDRIVNVKSVKTGFVRKILKYKNKKEEHLAEILLKKRKRWYRYEFDLNVIYYIYYLLLDLYFNKLEAEIAKKTKRKII